MTTPTGTISLNDVNVELGLSGTTLISMNQTNVRTLAGVPSGAISMNNLRGKSNRVSLSYTYSSNTADASLNLSGLSGYSAGKSDITVTINNGVYVYSTSTGGYGLNITGGTTGDTLIIVNNGYIMGRGGTGGTGGEGGSGAGGGPALNFGFSLSGATVTNTSGYIGGGGGGGGSGQNASGRYNGGGGGAGGGTGGNGVGGGTGGAGGGAGSSGSNGGNGVIYFAKGQAYYGGGGGGGRIMPGSGGSGGPSTASAGGGGGGAGGGGGGPTGASGGSGSSSGPSGYYSGGGGGGYGASGGGSSMPAYTPTGGGSGGKAINLNGKSITWTDGSSSSSRAYGAVS